MTFTITNGFEFCLLKLSHRQDIFDHRETPPVIRKILCGMIGAVYPSSVLIQSFSNAISKHFTCLNCLDMHWGQTPHNLRDLVSDKVLHVIAM